jgi:hypothetical protein
LAALLLLIALLQFASFCLNQQWGTHSLILLSALACSTACAWLGLRRIPRGMLRWDGERWHWAGTQIHAVSCTIDWQACMLLQIQCVDGRRHWLWLQGSAANRRWLALRRALVAARHWKVNSLPDSLP